MKYLIFYSTLCLLLFISCGKKEFFPTKYSFVITNSSQKTITLKFLKELDYGNSIENKQEITLHPSEKKVIRTFTFEEFSEATDILNTVFNDRFIELKFDTYVDSIKLDKNLWEPINWTYKSISKNDAEYEMKITNNIISN